MSVSTVVGHANHSNYQSSIDYNVAAYSPWAASATGGNDFAHDFPSGTAALYSTNMDSNIGKKYPEEWASTILAIFAIIITGPIYYFYRNGPQIRINPKFAQQVAKDREKQMQRRKTVVDGQRNRDMSGEKQSRGPVKQDQMVVKAYSMTRKLDVSESIRLYLAHLWPRRRAALGGD